MVPWSDQLAKELGELPVERKAEIKARRHPTALGMAVLTPRTVQADLIVAELVRRFGEARWLGGRWRVHRPQLRLPGF